MTVVPSGPASVSGAGATESDSAAPVPGTAAPLGLKWRVLDFEMQVQEQTNWCWAAVAVSVAHFYGPASTATQCGLADAQLRRQDCCGAGAGDPLRCDVYGMLGSSLYRVGHLGRWTVEQTVSQAGLAGEIDGCRPLCARVAWDGGGAHFVAVVGYLSGSASLAGSALVAVDDPRWGQSDVPYEALLKHYMGSGTWTDSFFTKS